MKKIAQILFLMLIAFATTSCEKIFLTEPSEQTTDSHVNGSRSSDTNENRGNSIECEILTKAELKSYSKKLRPYILEIEKLEDTDINENPALYRKELDLIENGIKEVLKPLIAKSDTLNKQIIKVKASNGEEQSTINRQKSCSAVERVECYLDFNVACLDLYNHGKIRPLTPNVDPAIDGEILYCLMEALGINDIRDICRLLNDFGSVGTLVNGTKMLISSKTAVQMLKAMGMRYLGWIGIAYSIYVFADCMGN